MLSKNLFLITLICMVNAGISFAQSDSDVLKYFETKETPTVYISRKAIKTNSVLQSKLIRIDRSVKADLENYVTKVRTGQILSARSEDIHRIKSGPDAAVTERAQNVAEAEKNGRNRTEKVAPESTRERTRRLDKSDKENAERRATDREERKPAEKVGIGYDFIGGKSIVYEYNRKVKTREIVGSRKVFDSASFISFDLRNNLATGFIADSCKQEIDSGTMYVETGIEVCKLEFPESSFSESPPSSNFETLDADLRDELGRIDISNVNDFYFFDTFIPPSSGKAHGESVRNLILEILKEFNASRLASRVKCVSLDFFENRQQSLDIINDYLDIKYSNEDINNQIFIRKQYYKIVTKGGCKGICMPSDFLNILLDYYLIKNPQPEVISMSFFMRTIFPVMCFSIKPNMKTNVLGAVLDNTGLIEDIDTDIYGSTYEPMFTLKTNILPTGSMLIGARSETGGIKCLHSSSGVNVSAIGHGSWGGSFDGAPSNYGTSWATPEIATKLFIAKAFWKSSGMDINALDAKIRLMLSCDLDTAYVGKFASGGIPDLNKLLRKNVDGFIEKRDSVFDIRLEGNPKIFFHLNNGDEILYNLKTGSKNNYIRGIYFKNDAFFIFQETGMRWERIDELNINKLNSVDFRNFKIKLIKTGREININTIQDLKNLNINHIVRL